MKKLESNLLNMSLVLTAVCLVSAAALSLFFSLTKTPIELSNAQKLQTAISEVLVKNGEKIEYDEIKEETKENSGEKFTIYRAFKGEELKGIAVETFSKNGFNGEIRLMVGFSKHGKIRNYSVLQQKETPGLGSKMVDWFKPQQAKNPSLLERIFKFQIAAAERESSVVGLNPKDKIALKKDGGNLDGITAATISSRAFVEAINRAYAVAFAGGKFDAVSGASQLDVTSGASVLHEKIDTVSDTISADSLAKIDTILIEEKPVAPKKVLPKPEPKNEQKIQTSEPKNEIPDTAKTPASASDTAVDAHTAASVVENEKIGENQNE